MVQNRPIENQLSILKNELNEELGSILNYWMNNTIDEVYGGFMGRIDENNKVVVNAPKGSVLNARILWSFSAAYNLIQNPDYLQYAERAYEYIVDHFIDKECGGVYWSIDYKGTPLDTKKQVYANAFTIYGLSEYYIASGNEEAKTLAIELYNLLVEKSFDTKNTGYLEAFTRDWQPINDLRLSAKDANEKKTMNTHLHVLEAYTTLYRIWQPEELKLQIETLIHNFLDHFIDPKTHHCLLFFDEDWNSKSGLISYGHDIEVTWLLQQAAEVINNKLLLEKIQAINISITETTISGLDSDGGLWYEYEPAEHQPIKQKHWWVQAEAMVGFYNTWQITGDEKYLTIADKNWQYIKAKILDKNNGEWLWGRDENGEIMKGEDKAGIWKCPYHNSRACIEIIKRISE
ncbi:MAG: AGE family epimerase/isomerase [Sphingobacteriales bacterium]